MSHARPFSVSQDLYPFEDHWFEQNGVAMHYVDTGHGTPVVFFHGNPTWSFLYRDVIARLPNVRALAADLPGFGMSQAPANYGFSPQEHVQWLGAWLDQLDLPPFVAVVQDWGGPTGLRAVLERSDRVAGLVVLNTWCWRAGFQLKLLSHLISGPIGWLLNRYGNFFARVLVPKGMVSEADKSDAVFAAYRAPFPTVDSRRATHALARAIRTEGAWLEETEGMLDRLRDKPEELVWAMQDKGLGNEPTITRWLGHFPGARVTRLPDASHYLQEDRPDAIAEAVERVVSRVEASRVPRLARQLTH